MINHPYVFSDGGNDMDTIKSLKIYDDRDCERIIGEISFNINNSEWNDVKCVSLPGKFRRIEANSIVYEGSASVGSKCHGCRQSDCEELDEDPWACQYCTFRTPGNDEYLYLPNNITIKIFEEYI